MPEKATCRKHTYVKQPAQKGLDKKESRFQVPTIPKAPQIGSPCLSMPIRASLPNGRAFDPEDVTVLSMAFEQALQQLGASF